MHWLDILFRFKGRLNRQPFWLALLFLYLAPGIVVLLFYLLAIPLGLLDEGDAKSVGATIWATIFLALVVIYGLFFLLWILAIVVKRLHDRDKSGWWILVYLLGSGLFRLGAMVELFASGSEGTPSGLGIALILISICVVLWFFIEVGFLRGTQGPNRFGADPLGATESDAAMAASEAAQEPSPLDDPVDALDYFEPRKLSDGFGTYLQWLFVSFQGRIRRRELWIGTIAIFVISGLLGNFADSLAGMPALDDDPTAEKGISLWQVLVPPDAPKWLIAVNGLSAILFLYFGISLDAKRLHDRGKSTNWLYFLIGVPIISWCLLIGVEAATGINSFAPIHASDPLHGFYMLQLATIPVFIVTGVWWFIELFIAPSQVGPNQWGPQIAPKPPKLRQPTAPH